MTEYRLNADQLAAVKHGNGPLLIIAGAGTGKTTVITKRIEHLILDKKVLPSEVLALTFTEKASLEMETRIDELLPYGYTQLWIQTFHAFCDRILRLEAIHIGLNPGYTLATEAEATLFLRKHLYELKLDYFRPLGNPYKFLQAMLTHFARLADDDITPDDYLAYAEKLQKRKGVEADDKKKTYELAHAFKAYEDLKAKEGMMDFANLIANVLKLFRMRKNILKYYQEKFKYVLVDEFQDTNFAQNELAILLAGDNKNITVVGDDDQCLPADTLVRTAQGEKLIKDIKKGEKVITAVGKGSLSTTKVNKVFKNKKAAIFLTIKTKKGATITTTDNHKMFCYVPKTVAKKSWHYVYLMHRKNLGWRLGVTSDLAVRLKLERSSDAIIGLRAFQTLEEARYHELLWALQYQIPTCIFKERNGVILQGKLLDRLYKQLNTEKTAKQLAENLGINLQYYHYVLDAVTRGQSKRVKINVYQCFRNYNVKGERKNSILKNPSVLHFVQMETSNASVIQQLDKNNITYERAKKGIRVRFYSSDLEKVHVFARQLAEITGGFIEMKSTIATLQKVNMPSLIMPASNLLEGLYIPVVINNHVYYDEIISITRAKKGAVVYDLEIDKTHNFIANGIVVHNSIYRWRGAAIANMLQFKSHFPKAKIITLNKNYRSTQMILDSAYITIQNNNPDRLEVKEKIDKKLSSLRGIAGEPIEFLYGKRVEDEAELVVKNIKDEAKKNRKWSDFAILVRANDHALPFQRALERARIPYQFLGPGHLFQQEEIKDLFAYLKVLANFDDQASLYRVLTMPIFNFGPRDIAAILNSAKKRNLTLFEALEKPDEISASLECKEKINRIVQMIKNHLALIPRVNAGQILYHFFEESGLLGHYLDPRTPRTERQAQNVAKLFDKLQSYAAQHDDASVFAVVDWIDLASELGEGTLAADIDWSTNDAVNILTIHSSKGLEFPVVFIVNLVAQRFPSRDRREPIPVPQDIIKETLPEGDENLQEERRLFYVATTRAKDRLFLTAASYYGEGRRERKISPFVYEALGKDYVDKILNKNRLENNSQQLSLLEVLAPAVEKKSPVSPISQITPTTPIPPITFLSYSQLQTFDLCPLHYKLRYIMKLPAAPSAALSFGTTMHALLKTIYQLGFGKKTLPDEMVDKLIDEYWVGDGYNGKAHEMDAKKGAKKLLLSYMEQNANETTHPLYTEMSFQFMLDKIKILGRFDRIDKLSNNTIEIIDYKTGSNVPNEKKIKNDLQLTLYALAATQINDPIFRKKPDEIKLTLYYIEPNIRISTTRTQEQLEEAKELILRKVEEIQQSSFHCSGHMFCKDCEYSMLCSTYTN